VFDATRAADRPGDLLPAIDMAGSELNAFGATGVPLANVHFAIVFHGGGIDGILNDTTYRQRHGTPNPNLKALAELKHAGVKLYVCGQNLASDHINPSTLSPEVTVATDALIVLMSFENDGYALLSY
jgi:intracellular sulfur oxidation DsrE/DsrF family protein